MHFRFRSLRRQAHTVHRSTTSPQKRFYCRRLSPRRSSIPVRRNGLGDSVVAVKKVSCCLVVYFVGQPTVCCEAKEGGFRRMRFRGGSSSVVILLFDGVVMKWWCV
ncbi:unnamed protein product [Lathyrus oleraceus]